MTTQSTYRILRSHARGGLGEVLVAQDERLGREVALKVIQKFHDRDPERRRRFLNEAEITSRLEHPGIVPVHGVGQDSSGRPCYAMRLIHGVNLQVAARALHEHTASLHSELDFGRAIRPLLGRFVSVCNAVAYAHSQGVIHRDLKPANIMLGAYGETLVVDWGLAKRVPVDSPSDREEEFALQRESAESLAEHHTRQGAQMGTPAYMSPEQAAGNNSGTGKASDIFSLGATLYVLLTGKPPFDGRNHGELFDKIIKADFATPRQILNSVPKPLEAICLRAMALQPSDRYPTPLALASDIEKWLADEPISAWKEPLSIRGRRWIKRHRVFVANVMVAILITAISLGIVLTIVSRTNHDLQIANQREVTANNEAQEKSRIADTQSALALETLQSVVDDIQNKLKDVPAAQQVRQDLLVAALNGLERVATNLKSRPIADRATMVAHRKLGDMFMQIGDGGELGNTESAREHFERAFEIAKQLADHNPRDVQAQRDLAFALGALGDISRELGASDRAEDYYSQSLNIRNQLQEAQPGDDEAMRHISLSFVKLGDLNRKLGHTELALEFFEKALDIRRQSALQTPNDPIVLKDLQIVYNNLGQVHRQLGSTTQALDYYGKAKTVGEQRITAEPNNIGAKQNYASTIVWLGDTNRQMRNFSIAREYYEQARDLREAMVAEDPLNVSNIGWLVIPLERLGGLCLRAGEIEPARRYFLRENDLLRQLVELDDESVWNRRSLAVSYDFVGDTFLQDGLPLEALGEYQKALSLREQLAEDTANVQAQGDRATSYAKIGEALRALGKLEEAQQQYEKALAAQERVVIAAPDDAKERFDLAGILQNCGNLMLEIDSLPSASTHFQKMQNILIELSVVDPNDSEVQAALALAYEGMGIVAQRELDYRKAVGLFGSSLKLMQKLDAANQLEVDEQQVITRLELAISESETRLREH